MPKSPVRRILDRVERLRYSKEQYARRKGVTIGEGCRILSNIVDTEPFLITIGDRVTISSDVRLITHDGAGWLVRDERGRRYRYARITIGSDVFIGSGVTVMPGVTIGNNVVVGARSVVTKSVPDGTVVAGIPARQISTWDAFRAKVLEWPSEQDWRGNSYEERVTSIAE